MAEYIEREAALREIERREKFMVGDKTVTTDAMKLFIKNRPAADVAPVVHARWIYKHRHRGGMRIYEGKDEMGETRRISVDERYEIDDPYCSSCGKLNESVWLNYCPNCGAKMDGGDGDAST